MVDDDKLRRTISIEEYEHGYFTVRIGEDYEDKLDFGEALSLVALLMIDGRTRKLRTPEQHAAFEALMTTSMSKLEDWQKQLAGPLPYGENAQN